MGGSLALLDLSLLGPPIPRVPAEGAGRRELPEFVPDHVLGDEYRDVLATVVNRDRQSHHVGNDHRSSRPRLDRSPVIGSDRPLYSLGEMVVDEGAFLD